MKKLLFLLIVFFGMINWVQVHAQTHNDAKALQANNKSEVMSPSRAAAMDVNIKEKMDLKTGRIIYFRQAVSPTSGQVTLTEVEYCSKSKKFVNVVSPAAVVSSCHRSKMVKRETFTAKGIQVATQEKVAPLQVKVVTNKVDDCTPAQQANCTPAQKAACEGAKSATEVKVQSIKTAPVKLVKNKE